MKVVLLAGGMGTRISEESQFKPKPMVTIGDMPILWHIMKSYSAQGFSEFVICAGYKQILIKEWFANYCLYTSDVTFDMGCDKRIIVHNKRTEPWTVTIVDTGLNTMTGGRIKRIKEYIGNEPFFLTYGDGVSNVDINSLLLFHKKHGKLATITAIRPESRYGVIECEGDKVIMFCEKSAESSSWINAGFMVLEPKCIDYISDDATIFERAPMEKLAKDGELMCYKHYGFWQCMDTLCDKLKLEELWANGNAPWKLWKD